MLYNSFRYGLNGNTCCAKNFAEVEVFLFLQQLHNNSFITLQILMETKGKVHTVMFMQQNCKPEIQHYNIKFFYGILRGLVQKF